MSPLLVAVLLFSGERRLEVLRGLLCLALHSLPVFLRPFPILLFILGGLDLAHNAALAAEQGKDTLAERVRDAAGRFIQREHTVREPDK